MTVLHLSYRKAADDDHDNDELKRSRAVSVSYFVMLNWHAMLLMYLSNIICELCASFSFGLML